MDIMQTAQRAMDRLPPPVRTLLERSLRSLPIDQALERLPFLRKIVDSEFDSVMGELKKTLRPYQDLPANPSLPPTGVGRDELLRQIRRASDVEDPTWQQGKVSGAVYHGDQSHIDFLAEVYQITSQTNPLHSDLWPSLSKYEAEVVSMTGRMLGGQHVAKGVVGTVSSGGTESILLAMKAYRDFARSERGIKHPEMAVPASAHAAFDKAAQYFGIKKRTVPVGSDYAADLRAMKKAINRNTVVIVASAPSFPHGIVDPVGDLSELAYERGIGCHVDACLGGFVLPWLDKKYRVAPFDFRLRGVSSMSVDTHKYGFASKGSSVVLYRNPTLREHQYFVSTEWSGGLYFSPTLAGSRPGAASAQCWAAMMAMGEAGYRRSANAIVDTAHKIKRMVADEVSELTLIGDPLWVLAYTSDDINIFQVSSEMAKKSWNLNGLHHPNAIHLCVTLPHTRPGIAEAFVHDLKEAVKEVKKNPSKVDGMAPVYGMAASLPARGVVSDMLKKYLNTLYEV